jgi:hypothetical protein
MDDRLEELGAMARNNKATKFGGLCRIRRNAPAWLTDDSEFENELEGRDELGEHLKHNDRHTLACRYKGRATRIGTTVNDFTTYSYQRMLLR